MSTDTDQPDANQPVPGQLGILPPEGGPHVIDVEHPEPRIIGVDEAADEDEDRKAGLHQKPDEDNDDPAEPDATPADPSTDNEPEAEPDGDGDNAPGEDAPAIVTLEADLPTSPDDPKLVATIYSH